MSSRPSPARKRIVIVEDDAAIARLVELSLAAFYDVSVVGDGAEALERIRARPPELVLLDVTLPSMDGFAIASALRSEDLLKKIPILFVTARNGSADVIRGISVGAKHYVSKPFNVADLMAKVRKLLPV